VNESPYTVDSNVSGSAPWLMGPACLNSPASSMANGVLSSVKRSASSNRWSGSRVIVVASNRYNPITRPSGLAMVTSCPGFEALIWAST
jgi:hypothetical protein